MGVLVAIASSMMSPSSALPAASQRGGDRLLGLPSLATSQQYVLAPEGRVVRPGSVRATSRTNLDFVTASSTASESGGHSLRVGTSTATSMDGTRVRVAGSEGGWFSYRLRVAKGRSFVLRVEEAGSSAAAYRVLVDGTPVKTRRLSLYAAQGRSIGLTAYRVRVPARLATASHVTVKFVNAAEDSGDGARIASVWTQAGSGSLSDQYGGRVVSPAGAIDGAATTLTSRYFGRPYVVYDFGREVGGKVRLRVRDASGSGQLGLAFSESRTFMTTESDFTQDPSGLATETHYFDVRTGALKDRVIRGGFRYLMVFLKGQGSVTFSDLRLRFTADPTNDALDSYAGSFLSSSEQLNKLWYSGAYSVQMATIASDTGRPYPASEGPVSNDEVVSAGDVFLSDGAKRDRYDWGGDNSVANVVAYLSTGETEAARNAFEWFAANPSEDGQIAGVYLPGSGFNFSWGEYAAWWMVTYWDYYLYTGDQEFLARWFDALTGNIAWFEQNVGDDGLWNVPSAAAGHWGYSQAGKETYDNAVYVYALGAAAAIAQELGEDELAQQWRDNADRTSAAINDTLWDETAGAYRSLPESSVHPLDANAMAVLAGIADEDRARRALSYVSENLQTDHGDVASDTAGGTVPDYISPFVSGLELRAFSAAGDDEGASDVLMRTWSHMLEGDTSGTLWETVSPDGELGLGSYTSMSHGWAATPTSYLTTSTLGVTPTSGGFDTFEVAPQTLPDLTWAQGAVPTPHGDIRTAWRQTATGFKLVVDPPDGTTYTAVVPLSGPGDQVEIDGSVASEPVRTNDSLTLSGLSSRTTITVTTGAEQ